MVDAANETGAHVVLVDPSASVTIERADSVSLSRNNPWHGRSLTSRVVHTMYGGRVTVSASRSDDRLRVEIFNNGRLDGSTTSGLGLKNTRERIQLMYGDKGSLELFSRNDGVVASLSIPWREIHTRHDTA